MKAIYSFVFGGLFVLGATAWAEVRPHALFGDHMVLQQGQAVPVWGTADAGETVEVAFAGQKVETEADGDGKWMVKLKPLEASAEGRELRIDDVVISDVLVGEVWVCSGQSNMGMTLKKTSDGVEAMAEADSGAYPNLRLFKVPVDGADEPRESVDANWELCDGETTGLFSATGFYFGRALNRDLGVPVGLIQAANGGTNAHSWINNETYREDDAAEKSRHLFEEAVAAHPAAMERFKAARERWDVKAKALRAAGKPVKGRAPGEPMGPNHVKRPTGHYNAMVAPVQPYAIAGAIWYQGEANSRVPYADGYRDLMLALVDGWRADWEAVGGESGVFPFYVVQLPNFANGDEWGWPVIREQMMKIWEDGENMGTVVTIDVGDATDIHPKNKMPVGERLAIFARGDAYDEDIVYSGPVFKRLKVKGDTAALSFDHAGGGLKSSDGEALRWFEIAGEDMEFVPATAEIKGKRVVVKGDGVTTPVAVRYAWTNNPENPNFVNAEGLLASPFRTDEGEIPAPEPQKK
ncbi:MAG: sialate O-acetylesterase [Verrucomicrobiota bacterium]